MPRVRASTAARGYGYAHQQLRKALLPHAYGHRCHLCGQVMWQWQRLALDHTVDRTGYRGIVHLSCNNSDGATRGNALRGPHPPRPPRVW